MLRPHHEAVDHCVHVADVVFVERQFRRDVDALAVDHHLPAALLTDLGEDEVQLFAVYLEYRRAQLDLGALGQRENRLQDLVGAAAWRRSPVRGQCGSAMVAKSRFR